MIRLYLWWNILGRVEMILQKNGALLLNNTYSGLLPVHIFTSVKLGKTAPSS